MSFDHLPRTCLMSFDHESLMVKERSRDFRSISVGA